MSAPVYQSSAANVAEDGSRSSQSDVDTKNPTHNADVANELEKGHPETAAALTHEIEEDDKQVRLLIRGLREGGRGQGGRQERLRTAPVGGSEPSSAPHERARRPFSSPSASA